MSDFVPTIAGAPPPGTAFDQAVDQFHKNISLHLDSTLDHDFLGRCYELKGMYQQAVEEYLVARSMNGATREQLSLLRRSFVTSGIIGFKREELNSALAGSKAHYFHFGLPRYVPD